MLVVRNISVNLLEVSFIYSLGFLSKTSLNSLLRVILLFSADMSGMLGYHLSGFRLLVNMKVSLVSHTMDPFMGTLIGTSLNQRSRSQYFSVP